MLQIFILNEWTQEYCTRTIIIDLGDPGTIIIDVVDPRKWHKHKYQGLDLSMCHKYMYNYYTCRTVALWENFWDQPIFSQKLTD